MLDEREFLSPYGIRALSRRHKDQPYRLEVDGVEHRVAYEPAESTSGLFGGNSNWRGPIWFPVNYLIIESLQKFHHYLGDSFTVECPTGSGHRLTLDRRRRGALTAALEHLPASGGRPAARVRRASSSSSAIRTGIRYIPFHEYFHGDDGSGVGASHQTGWSGLVAKLLQQSGEPGRDSA